VDDSGRISRRALVIGGAALIGATAVGVELAPDSIRRKLGLESSPDHHVPRLGARVRSSSFESAAMRGPVRYAVAVPADPRGVVVCLHCKGAGFRFAFDALHVHDVVAAEGVPLAVVGVSGGPDSYWHKRASGIDPHSMVIDELLPMLKRDLGPLPLAVMGWSMGGYGALLFAERHPDLFAAAVAVSPALFRSPGATSPGAFDDAADYRRNDVLAGVSALEPLTVRVDCGLGDPFLPAVRAFAARLPHPNPGAFGHGYHDAPYWRSLAPAQVRTIAGAMDLQPNADAKRAPAG
jgi:S-formylglutathione hydrolase FrmB